MLQTARSLGDKLVVVLSNDAHNHKPNAVPARTRLARLKRLKVADKAFIGAAHGFAGSLRKVKPDILVLGYDQRLPDGDTAKAVKALGVRVVVLPWFPGKEETLDLPGNK
jgi:FAD synthetase